MKVLWFGVAVPEKYGTNAIIGGCWQDSLQKIIVRHQDEVELAIAFENNKGDGKCRIIDGVHYYPIRSIRNIKDKICDKLNFCYKTPSMMRQALDIIDGYKPDIIHVFGSEKHFGLVAELTQVPVVIHMQGSIPPYNNAKLPPGYSNADLYRNCGLNMYRRLGVWIGSRNSRLQQKMEERILRTVCYYMGRTEWDKNIVKLYNPNCKYFYCSEALRPAFARTQTWQPPKNKQFRIVTTGVSTLWKGLDTILRTAHVLKTCGLDFEWICAGKMQDKLRRLVEGKEHMKYKNENVKILGYVAADELQRLLLSSDLYVHTAYIDNSPNAICEAQYIGMPIVATYVGGIPSLIENDKEGILVPANDPFTLAKTIMKLSANEELRVSLGTASRKRALKRHNEDAIYRDLIHCYSLITSDNK